MRGFLPSTGRLVVFRPPATDARRRRSRRRRGRRGVRVDTGVYEGGEIPMHYDSMICKLIACGVDRAEAIATMREALNGFVIRGVVEQHRVPGGAARPSALRCRRLHHRLHRRGVRARVRSGRDRPSPIAIPARARRRVRAPPAGAIGRDDRPAARPRAPARRAVRRRRSGVRRQAARDAGRGRGRWRRLPRDDRRPDAAHLVRERARRRRRPRPRRRRAVPRPDRARRARPARRPRRRAGRGARADAARRRAARADAVQAAARSLALPAVADAGAARPCRGRGGAGGRAPASDSP